MESIRRFHGRDLRKGRVSQEGQIYLLTNVTHDRQPLLADFYCGRALVRAMHYHAERDNVDSMAYVVMPDHFHWLVQLGANCSLAKLMASVKSYSARRIKQMRKSPSVGQAFWQDGYHDHALRKEEDVREVARYVVANPLRAGLVRRLGDWPLWDAKWL